MKRFLTGLILLGLAVAAIGLWVTRPQTVAAERLASLTPDVQNGETVFWAAGCASCHKAEGSTDSLTLPGGLHFKTPFGTFVAPNISPDPETGIGSWTATQFASAVLNGTSPEGQHYYPAFPYATYARMTDQDLTDLWAFMQTLPAVARENEPHDLGFPFNIRLSLGGWKLLFLNRDFVAAADTAQLERGRYLVEALGHCAECHTPRNALGGLDEARWMDGAPNPDGKGKTPGITPAHLDWAAADIAYYLETGFTPDFDSAGGEMAAVVQNIGKLTPEDRAAIAAYIKALP
ncbi:MAG: c-type cytochrome [Silicimonas sp.]|nr:c-type cytochrome [Silicimonas sp.]